MRPPYFIEVIVNVLKKIFRVAYYLLSFEFLKKYPILRVICLCMLALLLMGGNLYRMALKGKAMGKMFAPAPSRVATVVVEAAKWRDSLSLVGSLNSEQGAVISAEDSGKVSKINIENGAEVKAGQLIIEIDSVSENANLKASRTRLEALRASFKRAESLVKIGSISQEQLDTSKSEYQTAASEVERLESVISRRNIKAPFDGTAGIRRINVGDFVSPGMQIIPIYNSKVLNLDFNIPQKYLNDFTKGSSVKFTTDLFPEKIYTAQVVASDPQIDPQTRTIKIQARYENTSGELKPGIFAKLNFPIGRDIDVFPIPATSVAKAPYGDSVYVYTKLTREDPETKEKQEYTGVEQRFIQILAARGDQVGVISGLKPGEKIVTNGIFKLMPNMEVVEDNTIQPDNSANPHPENS